MPACCHAGCAGRHSCQPLRPCQVHGPDDTPGDTSIGLGCSCHLRREGPGSAAGLTGLWQAAQGACTHTALLVIGSNVRSNAATSCVQSRCLNRLSTIEWCASPNHVHTACPFCDNPAPSPLSRSACSVRQPFRHTQRVKGLFVAGAWVQVGSQAFCLAGGTHWPYASSSANVGGSSEGRVARVLLGSIAVHNRRCANDEMNAAHAAVGPLAALLRPRE